MQQKNYEKNFKRCLAGEKSEGVMILVNPKVVGVIKEIVSKKV